METAWVTEKYGYDLYLQCTYIGIGSIEDLFMQARRIRYDVIGLADTRRQHLFNAVYDTGEQLFPGICNTGEVSGVGVLADTSFAMNFDFFEQLTARIGRLRLKRCRSTSALTTNQAITKRKSSRSTRAWSCAIEKTIHYLRSS
ncbi:unnamed protein product [Angiostrongylus costaricensis]|uniref:Aldo_ket_red domain-containing protein n=1 Tax=Angiostrongylus costaricensis TaxID=334426 RepID=A0A0R3PDP5_ANGCS|nr:unnamed protein product [Angiostrongylus costaricensis]